MEGSGSPQLREFLRAQGSAGKHDSVGNFTLDLARATAKWASHRSDEPALPLLLLLQSAVRAGADEVEFAFERDVALMAFSLPRPSAELDPRALDHGWSEAGLSGSTLSARLRESLSMLAAHGFRSINWSMVDDREECSLRMRPEGVALVRGERRTTNGALYKLELSEPSTAPGSLPFTSRLQAGVSSRGAYAPLRIRVDSRPLTGQWSPQATALWHSKLSVGYRVAQLYFACENGGISLPLPAPELYLKSDWVWHQQPTFHPDQGPVVAAFLHSNAPLPVFPSSPLRCRGAVTVSLAMTGSDRVTFVRDGITLNPVVLEQDGAGFEFLWSGEGLTLDASGLAVVEDERLRERLLEVRRWCSSLLSPLAGQLHTLPAVTEIPLVAPLFRFTERLKRLWKRPLEKAPERLGPRLQSTESAASRTVTLSTKERLRYMSIRYSRE